MADPIFWLGVSLLLVAVSLTAVFVAALPAVRELARAARSAEKLFDTLNRELPPTLESIRLTGMEISDLTDEVSQGVQSAGQVAKQVDQSLRGAKRQAQQAQVTTRSMFAGVKAAWRTFRRPPRRIDSPTSRPSRDRLPPSSRQAVEFEEEFRYPQSEAARSRSNSRPPYRDEYLEDWEVAQATEMLESAEAEPHASFDPTTAPPPAASHLSDPAAEERHES